MKQQTTAKLLAIALLALGAAEARLTHHSRKGHKQYDYLMSDTGVGSVGDSVHWFNQRNDHFSKGDITTWKQKYSVNATLWGGAGHPIFVLLGGEGPMGSRTLSGGYVINEYAARARAMLVGIEHRFYGDSIPGDGTLSTANLKQYLSADQALADYAAVISHVKAQYNTPSSKVVTFGGSYSGSLSAWMRQKYPHIVHAALASSAPVLAQLDFPEYFEVLKAAVGDECAGRIHAATGRVEALLATAEGKAQLERDFRTCTDIGGPEDEVTFLESLADGTAGVVQYSDDANAMGRGYNIARMCSVICAGSDPYAAFVNFTLDYMAFTGEECTAASHADEVKELRNTDPTAPGAAGRSWYFQTCAEYGYYQTIEADDMPFSKRIDLKHFLQLCSEAYDIDAAAPAVSVNYTNVYYGGRNPHSSRIVFTNGSVDPWHALGNIEDFDEAMPVFYVKGTAHCADLYKSTPEDIPGLTAARTKTWEKLSQWLTEN